MTFIHDTARNLLIYQPPSTFHIDGILKHIPEAKQFNGHIAVPHTLRNARVLRWLNYPVAPIVTDENYDWPIEPGRKPLPHQRLMTNFMVLHPRAFNLSSMGAMKTISTLWAADWLMKQSKEPCRALIVAPLSILERVWANAIFTNFLSNRTFEIIYGDAAKRVEQLKRKADFYIINFDGVGIGAHTKKRFELDGLSKALAERTDIRIAIIDEASAYRDSQTKRHRIARLVVGRREHLWMLTGTPTPNAPTDAYGLAKMMNNAFGKSFGAFRDDTMAKVSNFKWAPRRDGYEKARKLLTPSIRFALEDVWDGPERTTQQRQVELTPEQKKHLAELKNQLQVVLKNGQPITAVNEAAVRTKFIQVLLGTIYDEKHRAHIINAKPRIDELRAVITEAPSKILLFSPLTASVEFLYKELGPQKDARGRVTHAGWTRAIVNGNTPQKERTRLFSSFQSDADPRILIADPGTMAHGLDLYAAQTVVWFGPTDKTELYLQANARAHRPGQTYPVTVVQLVASKLERDIYARLERNESMQGLMLDVIRRGEL